VLLRSTKAPAREYPPQIRLQPDQILVPSRQVLVKCRRYQPAPESPLSALVVDPAQLSLLFVLRRNATEDPPAFD
jgi:hypothetical protein